MHVMVTSRTYTSTIYETDAFADLNTAKNKHEAFPYVPKEGITYTSAVPILLFLPTRTLIS